MLQAESAEIGALQQCPRDGRRIVPAELPSAGGGSRCSARHPLTSCVDHRKLVPSRHIAPYAVQDDRQLAGERDLRFGGAGFPKRYPGTAQ
jgi:hypothetical protein